MQLSRIYDLEEDNDPAEDLVKPWGQAGLSKLILPVLSASAMRPTLPNVVVPRKSSLPKENAARDRRRALDLSTALISVKVLLMWAGLGFTCNLLDWRVPLVSKTIPSEDPIDAGSCDFSGSGRRPTRCTKCLKAHIAGVMFDFARLQKGKRSSKECSRGTQSSAWPSSLFVSIMKAPELIGRVQSLLAAALFSLSR
jgi:hypothetical protein